MPTGISLHIGLNSVDPAHYGGWDGPLNACEADANDMRDIAVAEGFKATVLLTTNGTRAKVVKEIRAAAKALGNGDFFLLTYSGHGGQIPDLNGDEDDLQDETWCLFDGQWLDDEIYAELAGFQAGVRIVVLPDSCHSGTSIKAAFYDARRVYSLVDSDRRVYRAMPNEVALNTYLANKAFYDKISGNQAIVNSRASVNASVISITGCQDNQLSQDGTFNGAFTGRLRKVWRNGNFTAGYRSFHTTILAGMPPDQSPNFFTVGPVSPLFEAQRPFTI